MRFCVRRSIGWPRIWMSPASGAVMFMIMRIVVVLPAPFGPRSPNIDPRGTASERLSTARNFPNDFETPVRPIAVSMRSRIITEFLGSGLSAPRATFEASGRRRRSAKPISVAERGGTPWRRGWDSNPRDRFRPTGFRDRPDQPLQHLSGRLGARILADSDPSVRRRERLL